MVSGRLSASRAAAQSRAGRDAWFQSPGGQGSSRNVRWVDELGVAGRGELVMGD